MTGAAHWNRVYKARGAQGVSWFADRPEPSLSLLRDLSAPGDAIVDIGGGASRLVDELLEAGYCDLTVLDLSRAALAAARARLGPRAGDVHWIVADVTRWQPVRRYRLWHDRAAFHFLTDAAAWAAYVAVLGRALAPGSHAVIATFADDGPDRCSGLPVMRYAPEALAEELERHAPGDFVPVRALRHAHRTPDGVEQSFQTSVFRRQA